MACSKAERFSYAWTWASIHARRSSSVRPAWHQDPKGRISATELKTASWSAGASSTRYGRRVMCGVASICEPGDGLLPCLGNPITRRWLWRLATPGADCTSGSVAKRRAIGPRTARKSEKKGIRAFESDLAFDLLYWSDRTTQESLLKISFLPAPAGLSTAGAFFFLCSMLSSRHERDRA